MMLKDKKILVVGAGGLLGSAVVNALLNHGALIIAADLNDREMRQQLCSRGVNIINNSQLMMIQLNVISKSEVISFFEEIENLDGAVNCTYPRNKNYGRHFFDVQVEDFNENIALHLGSSFLFSQQCAAYFLRNKTLFSLVNISSIYGVIAPKFNIYANTAMTTPVEYAAIKSALIHLNKYIISYVANSNFRINTISPGGILNHQPDNFLVEYKKQTLGKGMLEVDDVIGAILFLLSDYSKYMNGQNLIVDDGFSL